MVYVMMRGWPPIEPQPESREITPVAGRGNWMSNKTMRRTVALFVLLCGVVGSLLAGWQMKRVIEAEARARMERVCDHVAIKIRERLTAHALMLQGGVALMAASQIVTRDEWRDYLENLKAEQTVPGYQAVGFIRFVPRAHLEGLIALTRREGFPDYRVSPPGSRESYAPVVFIEPFAGRNLRAFGFDMFSDPVRRVAMERARDTMQPALSGKVTLRQEDGSDIQAGALIYVPAYRRGAPVETVEERRAALEGWVFGAYRMGDLMAGTLPEELTAGGHFVNLHVYDGDAAVPESLLFDMEQGGKHGHGPSLLRARRVVDFGGREWLLEFEGTRPTGQIDYAPAWVPALGGLAITGLLSGMMLLAFKRFDAQRTAEGLAEQIRGMAFHDSLTKLPNRLLLRDRLAMAMAAGKRNRCYGALMMIDLDNFKPLNDERGHAAGDLLLIEVARRIRSCVRETDTVARIGGDEFIVLLANLSGVEEAARHEARAAADKILVTLSRPYRLEAEAPGEERIEHRCSSSIGITLFGEGATSQGDIIKRADKAMYAAKRSGRNRTHFEIEQRPSVRGSGAALQQA